MITLSPARNLVDFGFIGVNPSGERIEGFSAPLQCLLFVLAYGASGLQYELFFQLQTWICTFLLGVLICCFMRCIDLDGFTALSAGVLTLVIIASSSHFLIFHCSGLENPITHVTYLAFFTTAVCSYRTGYPHILLVPCALSASWSRHEGIFHVLPLLIAFTFFHYRRYRRPRVFWVVAAFAAAWSFLFLVRFSYFGDLVPNTAHGQGIYVPANLGAFFDMPALPSKIALAGAFIYRLSGIGLVIGLLLLAVARIPKDHDFVPAGIMIVLGLVVLHAFVFGPAKHAAYRTVSFWTIFSALLLSYGLFHSRLGLKQKGMVALFVTAPACLFLWKAVPPFDLCCDTRGFSEFRTLFKNLAADHRLHRPFVANPDLGLMTFHKDFNVIDWGILEIGLWPL
ncbi:MAG: hypothetical protein V2B18_25145 [Pseudomonadota bacterium]